VPKARLLFALVATLVFAGAALFGRAAGPTNSEYDLKVWETDDGLPQGSVLTMVQTRDGYLWLGTLAGLVRFDGVRFTVFDPNNTPGLTDSRIVFLFEDSRRQLWIGTESGAAFIMKDRVVTPVTVEPGDGRLRGAVEESSGAVWLAFESALRRHADGKSTRFEIPPGLGRAVIQEPNGPIWVGTLRRQFAVTNSAHLSGPELPIDPEQKMDSGFLDALVAGRREGFWRVADLRCRRVVRDESGKLKVFDVGPYPASPVPRQPDLKINAATEDDEGNLVVGTGQGLFIMTPEGAVQWLTATNGLSWRVVLSVLVDRDGTLWIGTDGGGLFRAQKKERRFETIEAFRNWTVRSVTEDADGTLWIGSNGSGLGRYANGAAETNALRQYIRTVFADRERRVWIASPPIGPVPAALFMLKDGTPRVAGGHEALRHTVNAIHQDRQGTVWFGSEGGLLRFDTNGWSVFTSRDGLSATNVTALADDAQGALWIGTRGGGLNRMANRTFTTLRQKDGLPSEDISAVLVDTDGVLWVSTFTAGLARYHRGQWTRYTTAEGLTSNNLGYLLDDGSGNLWIGSNLGLLRVPRKALNDFATGAVRSIPCRAYGKADGLPTRECSSGSQPGAGRARDGLLWFPTIKGLVSLKPEHLRPNTNPPPITVEAILVDNAPVRPARTGSAETITLRPGDERLEIHFASPNLRAPDRARFRYRLDGLEKDWTEMANALTSSDKNYARYPKLPAGQYTFQVTASNEDGVWNETGTSLGIVVLPPPPPFWRTWWFLTFAPLTLIAAIVGIVHYLSTQKLQRQLALMRQQEMLEKERARIARDIHDQVGASLTQVALLGELVETDKDSPPDVEEHAKQICQTARETTRALDEIVWTVNPQNDTLEGLVNYICKNAQDYLAVAGVRYRFDVPPQVPAHPIPPDVRHHVFLASKEAVTNIVRHAKATSAWIRMKIEPAQFTVEIEDNGRGVADLDVNAPRTRHGLKNMRKRMEDVGGTFHIGPGSEGGALVRLTVPLAERVVQR